MIVLLCIAFALGGALFSFRLGDRPSRAFGIAAISAMVVAMLPEVAASEALQTVTGLLAAALGIAAFNRARVYRLREIAKAAVRAGLESDNSEDT